MVQITKPPNVWKIAEPAPAELFARFPEYPRPIVQLFHNRGLSTDEEIDRFLHPEYMRDLHDPFALGGMRAAVETIRAAIAAGEPIVVHGDYDADGLTAAALLHDVLKRLGARVSVFIPSRYKEGYGVARQTLERLRAAGAALVVTVDCGISDAAAIAAARRDGLKVVVTDHHVPPAVIPNAEAVVNPNLPNDPYPNKALTGVGVAFKVAQALLASSDLDAAAVERTEKWLLDLVAIGTVADMAELRGENRALVKFGLAVLGKTRRPGLQQLLRTAGVAAGPLGSETIGYALAPRLNAPGRVGHARTALELLLADSETAALESAAALERLNQERQRLTLSAVADVREQLGALTERDRIIFLDGAWKSGVVGLIAGRLVREFSRPAVVVERGASVSRGSVRSVPGWHVAEALQAHGELLESHGGHAQAGGFTVATAKLDSFRERLTAFARETVTVESLRPEVAIESELAGAELDWDLFEHLDALEPFGVGNPRPDFLLRRGTVEDSAIVGQDRSHLKLVVARPDGPRLTALAFGMADRAGSVRVGRAIDLAGRPVINRFNGSQTMEWHVTDLRTA